jgi:hypothetical protein
MGSPSQIEKYRVPVLEASHGERLSFTNLLAEQPNLVRATYVPTRSRYKVNIPLRSSLSDYHAKAAKGSNSVYA